MSTDKSTATPSDKSASLSLDTWAVIVALILALAVRIDILKMSWLSLKWRSDVLR
jgi:hypothetical protein